MLSRLESPDRRDGLAYVVPENVALAVRVASATGRPLLLRGDPGSGKSSLAAHVAREREARYYEHVVTSRTQARDLLWQFDGVRRLADAQAHRAVDDHRYVEPGVLWWAFARHSALRRGAPDGVAVRPATEPFAELNARRKADRAVVLVDEIDKADPDLPNGLLVPLGANRFDVAETGTAVQADVPVDVVSPDSAHLVVITTNEERELPQAFLRRCVVVWLEHPDPGQLVDIARKHLEVYEDGMDAADERLATELAEAVGALRERAVAEDSRPPSTAEFLDALRACRGLGISVGDPEWELLRDMALVKRQPS